MDDNFAVRLKKALELKNMKAIELAEKSGVQKSAISQYLSGQYEPKQKNIDKISIALNINPAWLMGHDVPFEKGTSMKTNSLDISGLDEEDIRHINGYIQMYKLAKNAKKDIK